MAPDTTSTYSLSPIPLPNHKPPNPSPDRLSPHNSPKKTTTSTNQLINHRIDIPTCTSHKIHVSNTAPPALAAATADTALFLLLAALRNFNPAILSLRAGAWRGGPTTLAPLGHDPYGKTLGILGMGGIGRNLAGKAAALGMNVTYHNRRQLPPADEGGARYVDFETLLEGSDVLSLNVPLNEKTKGMIGKEEFAKMKRGAVVVNTARGGGCG
ncbi:glyoxylate reductase, variant 2 [Xanthoria parietina]